MCRPTANTFLTWALQSWTSTGGISCVFPVCLALQEFVRGYQPSSVLPGDAAAACWTGLSLSEVKSPDWTRTPLHQQVQLIHAKVLSLIQSPPVQMSTNKIKHALFKFFLSLIFKKKVWYDTVVPFQTTILIPYKMVQLFSLHTTQCWLIVLLCTVINYCILNLIFHCFNCILQAKENSRTPDSVKKKMNHSTVSFPT